MALDFMTALRSRARGQERKARLSGRPLTSAETAAPYVALAETASARLARSKSLGLQERGLEQQSGQFGRQLEADRLRQQETLTLEQDRLAEQKRAEEARLHETKKTRVWQMAAAQEAQKRDERQAKKAGVAAGMVAGAAIGSMVPVVGTVAGAIIGGIIGYFSGGCIIISVCTDPQSYEVEVARRFRDEYLGPVTLIGYYAIAAVIAPQADKHEGFREWLNVHLIKHLIDHGEWVLGLKPKHTRRRSKWVSKAFLALCHTIGSLIIRTVFQEAKSNG